MHRRYGTGITELQSRIYISRVRRTQYDMPPHPTRAKIARDISRAELEWFPCDQHAPQCAE